jgi:TPR repeat protein
LHCASGDTEAQDFAAAARWYLKAAQQQHPLAQFNLGLLYAHGQGVPRDDAQALEWIRRSAHQGNAEAQFNLGMRRYRMAIQTRLPEGAESRIEAYLWLRLAAAQGYEGSEEACQRVTLSMTRAEVAEGLHRQAAYAAGRPERLQAQP